ncbi:hypothetical protein E2562_006584 [Oryza meyeriana var. granulata]|uniref:Transcription repressor n=1 Tax=Oryza meyeriana var. granulata TaxID=110450 RepID=A0A6G1EGR4_9ORYZ|nr:hypothetical protein E2562_006584 [Oryza meyeriana var. granulata]
MLAAGEAGPSETTGQLEKTSLGDRGHGPSKPILLHSSCTTTSATAFVSLAKTNAVAAGNAAGSRQAPPPGDAGANEPRPKIDGNVRRRRLRSSRALVPISIDCSSATSGRHSARSVGAAVMPSPVAPAKDVKAVRSKARSGKPRSPSHSCSSSTVTDDELPPFSSDGEGAEGAETRSSTLFSSLSISSDSTSDFFNSTGGGSKRHHKNPPRRVPRRPPPRGTKPAEAAKLHDDKDAKKADDKHGGGVVGVAAAGSMAVVKRSHNPYADFRSSMVEMVVERRICSEKEMEELLESYLSLNSQQHHPAILAAFEDVWEAVFGTP